MRTALLAAATVSAGGVAGAGERMPTNPECIAASESAQDLQHAGRFSAARAQFEICVSASCPAPIRQDCEERLDGIARATPSIVFDVTDAAGDTVPGLAITIDGRPVAHADGVTNTAFELDPGEHTFAFEAPRLNRVERRLVLAAGVKKRREVVIMDPAEAAQSGSTASSLSGEARRHWELPPTPALVSFGIGGAGLTLGVIAGLVAGGKHSKLEQVCDNGAGTCAPAHADDLDAFHTWRTVSTVGYVVGVLGIAGGAVLWFTAPRDPGKATTGVWLGPGSAGVAGKF